ncbi:SWIM zinc finger family protein [Tsukamurella sp. 8F]|uniref:SWIM zinc finger family protein n=1 Tax=unclassified Tsukamurella TaxID=2633480 RepID=UPI0023B9728A|nr:MULTISPECIES: SWIM zinc finger family protein [unclassified Tsukamurella]MDF0530336.1 SWIM zinc finger family protein [Tsukamurella sp. 8J]MDF0587633.1 SWIM zinc finger family protein [Tsukamurella sp. 8F]
MARKAGQRRMGGTWYTRILIRQAEDRTERRKVTYARRLYNERNVFRVAVRDAGITATVQGTQLDPFAVALQRAPGDAEVVLSLLAGRNATGEVMAVARGDLGRTLGGLVLPESASDVVVSCTCPDDSGACTHALAATYEAAAAMDTDPALVLEFAGVPLSSLVARLTTGERQGDRPPGARAPAVPGPAEADAGGFYGDGYDLPSLPEPAPVDPPVLLDGAVLRTALRRSGTRSTDLVQASEELAELYARIREPRSP